MSILSSEAEILPIIADFPSAIKTLICFSLSFIITIYYFIASLLLNIAIYNGNNTTNYKDKYSMGL